MSVSTSTNRLTSRMQSIAREGRKAFIAYIMAGDPSWEATRSLAFALDRAGVAAVELGVPFSDPIADGQAIQEAGLRALAGGVTLRRIFEQVELIRESTDIPILLMGYWNVFLQYGGERTVRRAVQAGVDGFIIADLPPDSGRAFYEAAAGEGLCSVLLATGRTSPGRLRLIAERSSGFIYFVPQPGTTGLELAITDDVRDRIRAIKELTDPPVSVGIGVKTREDVRTLGGISDGVVVGTRLVRHIHENRDRPDLADGTARLVRSLMG